jgi:hypothetical protein
MTFFRFELAAIILHSPLNGVILDDPSNLPLLIEGSGIAEDPEQSNSRTIRPLYGYCLKCFLV